MTEPKIAEIEFGPENHPYAGPAWGGKRRFRRPEDVIKWIDDDRAGWAWIVDGSARWQQANPVQRFREVLSDSRKGAFTNVLNTPEGGRAAAFAAALEQLQVAIRGAHYFTRQSDVGRWLGQLASIDQMRAQHALIVLLGGGINQQTGPLELLGHVDVRHFWSTHELAKAELAESTAIRNELQGARDVLREMESEYRQQRRLFADWTEQQKTIFAGHTSEEESARAERASLMSDALVRFKQAEDELVASNQNRIAELEDLYRHKLRLEGPVQYWRELYAKHSRAGKRWMTVAVAIGSIYVVGMICVAIVLLGAAEAAGVEWLRGLRGIFVLLIGASVGLYLINQLVRLGMSALHLAQDAQEREQLTHVFLALGQKMSMTDQERLLAYQALFSRADTGLLKGDNGPTLPMPGSVGKAD